MAEVPDKGKATLSPGLERRRSGSTHAMRHVVAVAQPKKLAKGKTTAASPAEVGEKHQLEVSC